MFGGVDKSGGGLVGARNTSGRQVEEDVSIVLKQAAADELLVLRSETKAVDGESIVVLEAKVDISRGGILWQEAIGRKKRDGRMVSASSQMASMLRDRDRNDSYEQAIRGSACTSGVSGIFGKKVLDIGTGTGLLAMMAAREGARSVVGCEMFASMAEVAMRVCKANEAQIGTKVRVLPKCSLDLEVGPDKDMDERAEVLIMELFDTALLGEGVLGTVRHARENLLVEEATIIPRKASVYVQLISCGDLSPLRSIPEVEVAPGITLSRSCDAHHCKAFASRLIPVHASMLQSTLACSKPTLLFELDFGSITYGMETEASTFRSEVSPCNSGFADAVLFWWELDMGNGRKHSTAPQFPLQSAEGIPEGSANLQNWQDHWLQAVALLPEPLALSPSARIEILGTHTDLDIFLTARLIEGTPNSDPVIPPTCCCGWHILCNYERAWMLADTDRCKIYYRAIKARLEARRLESEEPLIVVDVGDGPLLSLLAAAAGADFVICLEQEDFSSILSDQIVGHQGLEDKIKVIHGTPDSLQDIGPYKATMILGEPFEFKFQCKPLWEGLSFWCKCASLRPITSSSTIILPMKATLVGCLVEWKDLWRSHGRAGVTSGFDMEPFDAFQKDWEHNPFVYPMWMYRHTFLSEKKVLLDILFHEKVGELRSEVKVSANRKGKCHALVVWLEYDLGTGSIVSTGPSDLGGGRYHRQTVHFVGEDGWEVSPGNAILVTTVLRLDGDHFDIRIKQS